MNGTKAIIERWYKKLCFPKEFDEEFYRANESVEIPDTATLETYDKKSEDGARNLLSYLYFCEATAKKYAELGIPEEILLATLKDIVIWTKTWSEIKGGLYLGECNWLALHLGAQIFRLGRLQFQMKKSGIDIPKFNTKCGDDILDIHICAGEKLDVSECEKSLLFATDFFQKHFPNFKFTCFTCHSWLLDETLKKYLPETSNIIRFGDMFEKISTNEIYAILRYLFRWDTDINNLPDATPKSAFAERIKEAALRGEKFYETLGVIKR